MNVLIVDSHTALRLGMKDFFKSFHGNYRLYEATDIKSALHLLKSKTFGLVIAEIAIGKIKVTNIVASLRISQPATPVLIYSTFPEKNFALPLLRAGASGFVSKSCSVDELSKAIMVVLAGGKYISMELQSLYLPNTSANYRQPLPSDSVDKLSERENTIMKLLIKGGTTRKIAASLRLKDNTVSTYKRRIFQKMQVSDSIELFWKVFIV